MKDAVLIEVLTDLQVEIQAIHMGLAQVNVPTETIQALRSDIDRDEARKLILAKLAAQQADSDASL